MKLKITSTAILLLLFFAIASAQKPATKLYGKLNDNQNNPMVATKVTLFPTQNTLATKHILTDTVGSFLFEGIEFGKYQISIEALGYEKFTSAVIDLSSQIPEINLGDVRLKEIVNNLNAVNIDSKKAFVEQKMDRTVVNVDALISNAGTSALDVLSKSPGVSVDQNGLISLKGKSGVNIFIDDKPTYLSGPDLEAYLRSLPSSDLAQIELMTNPPARYDAAGNAGVINIKTKKSKIAGFNGSLNTSVSRGQFTRSNNSLNLNYRKNKINVFGNFSHNLNNSLTDLDLNRTYLNEDKSPNYFFDQNTIFRRNGNTVNAKVGLDFYQSENTTWGFAFTGATRKSSQSNTNVSNFLNSSKQTDSVIKAVNEDLSRFNNLAFNANYRHQFGKDKGNVTVDIDYLNYNYQVDQNYVNYSYLANTDLKYQDLLTGDLPSKINIYTAKSDYERPLSKQWKFAGGLKTSYIKTNNVADYLYTRDNITNIDYEKTNNFLYSEHISSGYVNFSMEAKRLSAQAGLRVENTISNGNQLGNIARADSTFNRRYTNIFPTVYLSYKLDSVSRHQIGINYGRRIDRPLYRQLNPFYYPLDKFTYYLGNPFLSPTFTNALELSHTYKSKITTTFGYSWIKDQVNETIEIIDGIYYSRPGNIGKGTVASVSVNADLDLTKWLTAHVYMELDRIITRTNFYTGYLVTKGSYFRTTPNLQFKISKSWNAEANFSYSSKISSVQLVIGDFYEFGAAVQKKLSDKSNLKFSATDIFRTRVVNGVINNLASTTAGWVNRGDTRNFILSYSYRFGKSFKNAKQHNASGADAEKRRAGS